MTYEETGRNVGIIVDDKNKKYGDSFAKCPQYLNLLYPDGIKPEQYKDMLALVRDFDKNMRIATDKDALGENPWSDKAGYAILSIGRQNFIEKIAVPDSPTIPPQIEHSEFFYDRMR